MAAGWPLAWNGDGWRAVLALRTLAAVDVAVGDFDFGCAVLRRRPNTDRLLLDDLQEGELATMSWEAFDADRARLLRLMDFEALKVWKEEDVVGLKAKLGELGSTEEQMDGVLKALEAL